MSRPEIALGVQARPKEDLIRKAVNLRNLGQQSRINELNIQNAEAAQATSQVDLQKAEEVDRIFGQSVQEGWEPDRTRQALYQVDPVVGQQWDEFQTTQATERRERGEADLNLIGGLGNTLLGLPANERNATAERFAELQESAGNPQIAQLVRRYDWTDDTQAQAAVSSSREALDELLERDKLAEPPDPTTGERDFQSFYEPWLEANGLERSARNEVTARRLVKNLSTASGKQSMQEELAELYTKRDTEGLSRDERSRLSGIESSMTLVARNYARYDERFNPETGRTEYFFPGTNQRSVSPEGTRPELNAGEIEELSTVDEMLTQIGQLRTLAKDNPQSIGSISGRFSSLRSRTTGGGGGLPLGIEREGSGAEVAEMFRISDGTADLLLRARSGAQINEQEYARLRQLVPNPRSADTKFWSDLDSFEAELQRVQARRTGAAPLITPESERPGPQSQTRELDDATARRFLEEAGGDRGRARQLAREAGYTWN